MTSLIASGVVLDDTQELPDGARSFGSLRSVIENVRSVLSETIGSVAPTTLTISAGAITPVRGMHLVDTEAAAASDDLDRLTVPTGSPNLVTLAPAISGRWMNVRSHQSGSGEIQLLTGAGTVFKTSSLSAWILLALRDTVWVELHRSYGEKFAQYPADSGSATKQFYSYQPNGRLIQYGRSSTSASADITVSLPVPYGTTDYHLQCTVVPSAKPSGSPPVRIAQAFNKQTTDFELNAFTVDGTKVSIGVEWVTEGDIP